MAQIDYYFSTISPFSYLAGTRLEDVAQKHGAAITYKPLDIMGLFSRMGGTPVPQRHESRRAYRLAEMRRQAKKTGLKMNPQPMFWPTNAAPSSYAIITAQANGGGDLGALAHGIMARVWDAEDNIAENDVIRAVLGETGFDPDFADKGMLEAADRYARNLEDAVTAGVFGAPSYVVDGTEMFWGQDRLEDLDLYLSGAL